MDWNWKQQKPIFKVKSHATYPWYRFSSDADIWVQYGFINFPEFYAADYILGALLLIINTHIVWDNYIWQLF